MKKNIKRRTPLAVKGQRTCQRNQSLQRKRVVRSTKVEHLVTHLTFQEITVSVNQSKLKDLKESKH